jgi:hypothetical protein
LKTDESMKEFDESESTSSVEDSEEGDLVEELGGP